MKSVSNNIIILGAGPTGLMLANQLTRFGVDYIILDQKAGPTDQSRALVVQARSMEIYEQLGLSDQIISEGQKNDGLNLYKNGKQFASVNLVNPDERSSPFSFLMMYEQSKNEALLYNNLLAHHMNVQWNTSIISIKKENDAYFLESKQGNEPVTFQCKYLIACDGSKSIARDFAAMDFTGGTYLNVFYVADTHADADLSSNKLSLFLTERGVTMLFPMKGNKHFRALGILPEEYYHHDEISFEEILEKARAEMKIPVKFYDTQWHSTYKLHHKKVTRFSIDNLFFMGDAAHVHSPVGGQGMNTGLQDAYNLAWKLALVQKGKAGPELLATYHEERNPVATDLLKTTDRLFATMSSGSFWQRIFRLYIVPFVVPLVTRSKFVRHQLFVMVSQLKINYRNSSLSKGSAGKIWAGLRLPYVLVKNGNSVISIYELTKTNADKPFTILLYGLPANDFGQLDKDFFKTITIDKNEHNDKVFKDAGFSGSFIVLIRPDNYIGYISSLPDAEGLKDFLKAAYFI